MPNPHPPYVLEPRGAFTPDPDGCWHCRNNPGYTHRHWRQQARPAPARQDGPIMRAFIWVWGDWGLGRQTQ